MAHPRHSSAAAISLPDEDTDEGALVRLLMVEVGAQPGDPDGVKEAMGLMKRVIENRLQRPQDFYANHATIRDIIRVQHFVMKYVHHKKLVLSGEQFAGFMDYPKLAETQEKALDADLTGAAPAGEVGEHTAISLSPLFQLLKPQPLQTRRRQGYTHGEQKDLH